jgi:hypothetical protein
LACSELFKRSGVGSKEKVFKIRTLLRLKEVLSLKKDFSGDWAWWLMPVILATWEVEIRRVAVLG